MKAYTNPELNVTKFSVEDIITVSSATAASNVLEDAAGENVTFSKVVTYDASNVFTEE